MKLDVYNLVRLGVVLKKGHQQIFSNFFKNLQVKDITQKGWQNNFRNQEKN